MNNSCNLAIAFGDGTSHIFQALAVTLNGYCATVTPEDGSEPFTAILLGCKSEDSEWLDEIEIQRCDDYEPIGEPEFIRVRKILVY